MAHHLLAALARVKAQVGQQLPLDVDQLARDARQGCFAPSFRTNPAITLRSSFAGRLCSALPRTDGHNSSVSGLCSGSSAPRRARKQGQPGDRRGYCISKSCGRLRQS